MKAATIYQLTTNDSDNLINVLGIKWVQLNLALLSIDSQFVMSVLKQQSDVHMNIKTYSTVPVLFKNVFKSLSEYNLGLLRATESVGIFKCKLKAYLLSFS